MSAIPDYSGLLVLPRLRVQNANAISSPTTWGFPAITAFLGLMCALERKTAPLYAMGFSGVGVVCHGFEPQVTSGGFTRAFHLTRNPLKASGAVASIVEEGRAHLDVTLVFGIAGAVVSEAQQQRLLIAQNIADIVATMRIAGGSIVPSLLPSKQKPEIIPLEQEHDKRLTQFRTLRRRWLPGFSLVSRHDLLHRRILEMQAENPGASALDAWLDCSRLNWRAVQQPEDVENKSGNEPGKAEWQHSRTHGWIVPIPVGYAGLSALHPAGTVINARDGTTPFRFVEAVYSLGQWIGPHRVQDVQQLLWYAGNDSEQGIYRCYNDYRTEPTTVTQ